MDPREFLSALLNRAKTNPSRLAKGMKGHPDLYVSQSVISRFLKGDTEMTYENARRLGKHFGFDPRALTDPEVTEDEAVRIGLIRLDDGVFPDKSELSYLTPTTVHAYSGKNSIRAPVVEWARLGDDLFKESSTVETREYIDTPSGVSTRCKWFVADESIPAFGIKKGYKVALDPNLTDHTPVNDDLYLFKDIDGAFFLAEYRKLAGDGFEAVLASGRVLDRDKHGLKIVAIHRGTWK